MQMYIVQVSYNENIAFTCPEDAAQCIEALLRGQRVNEQSMNGKTAYAIDDTTQLRVEAKQAEVYATIQERYDALKENITFWIDKKRHNVNERSVSIDAFRSMAGVDKTKKIMRVKGDTMENVDITKDWGSVTVKEGEEYVTQL